MVVGIAHPQSAMQMTQYVTILLILKISLEVKYECHFASVSVNPVPECWCVVMVDIL